MAKKRKKRDEGTAYAQNPRYCMIMPDAEERDDDSVVSTGQS